MAGAPEGNQNASKSKRIFTAALKRVLTQAPNEVDDIVNMLIGKAKEGEPWAVKELIDRVDGKAPQPLTGGDDDENPITVKEILIRAIAPDRSTEESG